VIPIFRAVEDLEVIFNTVHARFSLYVTAFKKPEIKKDSNKIPDKNATIHPQEMR
jgi:hypothetical protein